MFETRQAIPFQNCTAFLLGTNQLYNMVSKYSELFLAVLSENK
jgi:hypothetical protein